MKRRTFLGSGAAVTACLAGCSANPVDSDESDDGTLAVATYGSFVDAPSDSPGAWIKEEFDARHDATLEWHTPDQGINYYIERHNSDVEIEPDLYLGFGPHELVRVDRNTDGELFGQWDESRFEHLADVDEQFYFDPQDRTIPVDSSYCALVYDGRTVPEPETLEDLLDPAYEGRIALANPQGATTGLLFLLWTIDEFGEEGYLEYWQGLLENDVRILDSWADVYTQFEEGEAPVIVSYSNDRVYAKRAGSDLEKHRVAMPNGEAYASIEGMARFAEGTNDGPAHQFADFVLSPEVQAVIAERNVTGPVNTEATPPEVYREFAREPDEPVFFGYDALAEGLPGWIEDWSDAVAGGR
ncbi:thiamine ABC transporter substrate-binding protein [Halalkalicoccus jeotgali]|uniref:Thiamine-binding periplasmic protein-like protein n=1 Tax=Halalkalicoccus jeotgali (strain DSM 18796 / CECT 7217 / JCM 14584 / KCTC 4019 / B3) TaxID=795797 RepID=D8J7D5_HALJB|nr:thiamine ABC transporter substrate-binding protein [Halalkalicoccus jeotgali]ADJ14030.1 thiamine-binding periplasmic protein precursor-like protein [Halalkalicoccus jeotgali B3]ELY33926.1 thiamine-binding periplasmic protein -like protein [Halalkalicoccus jeotgali B3]